MNMLIVTPLVLLFLLAAFGLLFWKLASRTNREGDSAEWLQAFSMDRYAPMERLLDPSDLHFLESQPGYRPEIGKRLLRERKQIFLDYLRLLIGDFNRLLQTARLMIVYADQDRADFAGSLWRQQIAFYGAFCVVRLRVAFYPLAWNGPDVSQLMQTLETMRKRVHGMGLQPPLSEPA